MKYQKNILPSRRKSFNYVVMSPGSKDTSENIFGRNLVYYRNMAGLKQRELAEKIGLKGDYQQQKIYAYEAGLAIPRKKRVDQIATVLGIDPSLLFAKSLPLSSIVSIHMAPIPVFSIEDLYRHGIDDCIRTVRTKQYVMVDMNDPSAFAVRIDTDDMAPRFNPGDVAIISRKRTVESGDYALVCINHQILLRQVFFRHNEITVRPLNDKYPEQTFTKPEIDSIDIFGPVIVRQERIKPLQ